MPRVVLLLFACLIVQPALAPAAHAQIRRCVDAQGRSIYTDRPCAAFEWDPLESTCRHASLSIL